MNPKSEPSGESRLYYRNQLIRGAHSNECICETLRMAYDLIHNMEDLALKEALTNKLLDAFICGKKMHDRLIYYRDKYKDSSGSDGEGLGGIPNTGDRLRMRRKRIIE